jgi:hypothetical protein
MMMSWTPTSSNIILYYVLSNTDNCSLGTGFKLVTLNVSLSSGLQFFMINFMDMCILNYLHHSLSFDNS